MKKLKVLLQRLLQIIPVLLGISIVTFVLAQASPGDPVRLILGPRATAEAIATVRADYGLDEPILKQYSIYMRKLLQGDWGRSISHRTPVLELLATRFTPTLYLLVGGMLCSVIPALILGIATSLT